MLRVQLLLQAGNFSLELPAVHGSKLPSFIAMYLCIFALFLQYGFARIGLKGSVARFFILLHGAEISHKFGKIFVKFEQVSTRDMGECYDMIPIDDHIFWQIFFLKVYTYICTVVLLTYDSIFV